MGCLRLVAAGNPYRRLLETIFGVAQADYSLVSIPRCQACGRLYHAVRKLELQPIAPACMTRWRWRFGSAEARAKLRAASRSWANLYPERVREINRHAGRRYLEKQRAAGARVTQGLLRVEIVDIPQVQATRQRQSQEEIINEAQRRIRNPGLQPVGDT